MAYASGEDLVARYDARLIGDMLLDNGTGIETSAVPTHANVLTALADASGDIDAALQASERYSETDLSTLSGNALALLKRITCELAFVYLSQRRGDSDPEKIKAFKEAASTTLDQLRKGIIVLPLDAQKAAGLPEFPEVTTTTIDQRNSLRDRVQNYFPARRYQPR